MLHPVRIKSKEQYKAAIEVLDNVNGTWHARGPSSDPVLLLPDEHYNALIKAGVIPANGNEVKPRVKKAITKKTKS
jgi:hypothetical protein